MRSSAVVLGVVGALVLAACTATSSPGPAAPAPSTSTASRSSVSTSSPAESSPARATNTGAAHPDPSAVRHADVRIAHLTGYLGRRGVSIEAVDPSDGVTFGYGARNGMLCASIAKLFILETLLLQQQRSGQPLSDARKALATEMIENSDNDAANALYVDIGEGSGFRHAAPVLKVEHTTPGTGIYWGFTRTGAGAYLALLRDLEGNGPLDAASRHFALRLLSHVEADQRWGVGTVAAPGTTFYNKNGWLAVSTDDDRWAVNTVGIVTVHGRRLLMVIMTQHGTGFDSGVDLVDHLARITAHAVTTTP